MATFKRFEDIESWQGARGLTREIYKFSSRGDFATDFGLKDQIRRAAVSVMANIAEGFEQNGTKEFIYPFSFYCQRLHWRGASIALCGG